MVARKALAVVLISLLAVPAAWAGPRVVGSVTTSQAATIRGMALSPGTTVYAGDRVVVGREGAALVALGRGSKVLVGEQSRLLLAERDSRIEAELESGRASLRLAGGHLTGVIGDAQVRAAGDAAVANLGFASDTMAVIFAERGELLVTAEAMGEMVRLREGEALELTLAEPAQMQGDVEPDAQRRRRRVLIWGLVFGGAAGAAALAIALNRDKLSDKKKRDAVSPFQFP